MFLELEGGVFPAMSREISRLDEDREAERV